MPVLNRIAEFHDEMKEWRQWMHRHPELLYELPKTRAYVIERLREFGVDEIEEDVAGGVVALIAGQGEGPTIGLRADMDALPIEEATGLPYASTHPGKMHACGHDGHTTMLLGAAKYLAETRNFAGRVALLFQPAEEGGAGGLAMVKAGVMERHDIARVFGMHNWPGGEAGAFAMRPGPLLAAGDSFDIHITGRGAHAASPEEGIDSVLIAAQIAQALYTIPARNVSAIESVVLSVTQISAGNTHNVIPGTAYICGTVRTLTAATRDLAERRVAEIAEGIAAAHGASARVEYDRGYPVTENDPDAVAFAADVARQVAGDARVDDATDPEMASEDFSYMLEARPGAYVFIGQGESAGLHHPEYNFNDEISPVGATFFARLVETAQPVAR
ncbi:MAG: M20 aminoacylase family protein [Pseudomonadota bacterium]